MRKIFFAVVCILIAHDIQSQSFDYIDEKVKAYPEFYSTKKLAKQINADFSTDLEKARAIYYWITHNIAYDYGATNEVMKKVRKNYHYKKGKMRLESEQEDIFANYTIRKRIAVCAGYSMLFKQLCDLINLHCHYVSGKSKNEFASIESAFAGCSHAWNVVLIDGDWYLVDSTWGAGGYSKELKKFIPQFSEVYFMTRPELFFLNHYPKDEKWLLMEKSKVQFGDLPLFCFWRWDFV